MPSVQLDQALANGMVEKALAATAADLFAGNAQDVLQAIRQGRCDICCHCSDRLVQLVSEYLGQMDKTVKAIYRYEPEYSLSPPQPGSPAKAHKAGINLIAWVARKSPALHSLGATLKSLLTESRLNVGCRKGAAACYVLDISMVDDRDIDENRGYGAIIQNTLMRSFPAWTRPEPSTEPLHPTLTASNKVDQPLVTFDAELAPEQALFEQARAIEGLPRRERSFYEHRLLEIKVALIRRLISDQLAYINIAKQWFTLADLEDIHSRKIGYGKIGGKAAGMMLAARILKEMANDEIKEAVVIPESYFLGSDLIYLYTAMNGLMHWNDQKYKPEDQIRSEYAQIQAEFQAGSFPPEILDQLRVLLATIGPRPIIVRSSSQLEDNFGTSFAGKYNSFFCANQGTPEENLAALTCAIARTYASTLNPDALLYRRSKGLQDYDERMAILIQVVQGERFGRYFLPYAAGVAFSRNLYRWSPQIRREDGMARMVWGLGTRAVERVGNDFPRMVALSHPTLQPSDSIEAIRHYSQQYVDLIDLEENTFTTLPIHEVLKPSYPPLRYLVQMEQEGYLSSLRSRIQPADVPRLTITFLELLRRTNFAPLLAQILRLLQDHYHVAVDMEFTVQIDDLNSLRPRVHLSLLQCRPQSYLAAVAAAPIPTGLKTEEIAFYTSYMVPQGSLNNLRYVLFVPPEGYFSLPTQAARNDLTRTISRLNETLPEKSFICVGPGRWGTTNPDLGVYVGYSDVYRSGALIELSGAGVGTAPDPSLGTHFFQDLMEAQIYPLVIDFDAKDTVFNREFFYNSPNCLSDLIEVPENLPPTCLRLIDVNAYRPGHYLELVMDDEKNQAVAFFKE